MWRRSGPPHCALRADCPATLNVCRPDAAAARDLEQAPTAPPGNLPGRSAQNQPVLCMLTRLQIRFRSAEIPCSSNPGLRHESGFSWCSRQDPIRSQDGVRAQSPEQKDYHFDPTEVIGLFPNPAEAGESGGWNPTLGCPQIVCGVAVVCRRL